MKARVLILVAAVMLATPMLAMASIYDVAVLPLGDAVYYHAHWAGGSYNAWNQNPDPNTVSYSYSGPPADVSNNTAYLQFGMPTIAAGETIQTVSLNFYLLSVDNGYGTDIGAANIYHRENNSGTNGRGDQGYAGDQFVLKVNTQPLGWVTADVTSYLLSDFSNNYDWSAFSFNFTANGYGGSGMSFANASSANAAYLRFTTNGSTNGGGDPAVVPEPMSLLLLGSGFLSSLALRKRKV